MARVVAMLEGVSEFHLQREKDSRKRKRVRTQARDAPSKKTKIAPAGDRMEVAMGGTELSTEDVHSTPLGSAADVVGPIRESGPSRSKPPILQHLTLGINEVTKMLEKVVRSHRHTIVAGQTPPQLGSEPERLERLVLVCRGDVDPPILIGHLPHLIAACNSVRRSSGSAEEMRYRVWLVPLAKGAEHMLAEALGLRRASVIAIDSSAPEFAAVGSLLEGVPVLNASWLTPQGGDDGTMLIPTHIKLLRTTAPKDMKVAKDARVRGKAAAKERKKVLRAGIPKVVEIAAVPIA